MQTLLEVMVWIIGIVGGGFVFLGIFGELIYDVFFRKVHCQGYACDYAAKLSVVKRLDYKISMKTYTDHGGTDPYSYRNEAKVWSCPKCNCEILTMKL